MASSPENKGTEAGDSPDETKAEIVAGDDTAKSEVAGDLMRESNEDLGSMHPVRFFHGLEERIAKDPDSPGTRRWKEEAKRRMRIIFGYLGVKIIAFAFDMSDGKMKIVLTIVGDSFINAKIPRFLLSLFQKDKEQKELQKGIVRVWMTMRTIWKIIAFFKRIGGEAALKQEVDENVRRILEAGKREQEERAAKQAKDDEIKRELGNMNATADRILGLIRGSRKKVNDAVAAGDVESRPDEPADPDDKNEKK
jgi:RNA polymerase-interacting CarD/CdnL/TRCF family regulator